jgi:hypothetical protein
MTKQNETLHLVMRVPKAFMGSTNTIEQHRDVIRVKGKVWMTKLGKRIGGSRIQGIREQIRVGIPSFVYFVTKEDLDYRWAKGTLAEIQSAPPPGVGSLVPAYYAAAKLAKVGTSWLLLTAICPAMPQEIALLHVASSGRPISEIIRRSMAALFLVSRGKGTTKETSRNYWDDWEDPYAEKRPGRR